MAGSFSIYYNSKADVEASDVPSTSPFIDVVDYGRYRRVDEMPLMNGIQSGDGAYWELEVSELQGPPGPQGEKGDKGDQGDPGPPGAPGEGSGETPQVTFMGIPSATLTQNIIELTGHTTLNDCPERFLVKRLSGTPSPIKGHHKQDASGAWFQICSPILTLEMFGGKGDNATYNDNAMIALAAAMQAGISKRARFTGTYRVMQDVEAFPSVYLFAVNAVHGVVLEFCDAKFIVNADQLAMRQNLNWVGVFFYFYNCKGVRILGVPEFSGNITRNTIKPFGSAYGMFGIWLEQNCSGFDIDGATGSGILCPINITADVCSVQTREQNPTVIAGGTGYQVGDQLTLAGGTGSTAMVCGVGTIGANGAVTSLYIQALGVYPWIAQSGTTLPTITVGSVGYTLSGGHGTGCRAAIYMERVRGYAEHSVGGRVGMCTANDCFYGYVQRDSGDFVHANVYAEYCYRAAFVYGGITGGETNVVCRHIYRTAFPAGGGFAALGPEKWKYKIRVLPYIDPNYSTSDALIRIAFYTNRPTYVDMEFETDVEYGILIGRAPNLFEVTRYNLGIIEQALPTHGGRIKWTGSIRGKSDRVGGAGPAGTHFYMDQQDWNGAQFDGWRIGPLDIKDGGDVLLKLDAFPAGEDGVTFDVRNRLGTVSIT